MRDLLTLPKANLHVHLESTVSPATLRELAAAHGAALPPAAQVTGFASFFQVNALVRDCLRTARCWPNWHATASPRPSRPMTSRRGWWPRSMPGWTLARGRPLAPRHRDRDRGQYQQAEEAKRRRVPRVRADHAEHGRALAGYRGAPDPAAPGALVLGFGNTGERAIEPAVAAIAGLVSYRAAAGRRPRRSGRRPANPGASM